MVATSLHVITVLEEIKPVEVMSLMCVNNGCADLTPPPRLFKICSFALGSTLLAFAHTLWTADLDYFNYVCPVQHNLI